MFHGRGKNNKTNRLNERCLLIIELLENDNSISITKRKSRFLVIEMFKFKRCLTPVLRKKMIPQNRQSGYELRNNADLF